MNWILTILAVIFFFLYYKLFGSVLLTYLKYEKKSDSRVYICGFIGVTFIQWLIGFPCQVMQVSWYLYFWSYLSINVISIILLIYLYRKKLDESFITKDHVIEHIKCYWFIYVMAIAFTAFSITNMLAYYEMNYDDSYYLAAIVQNVGSDHIATVNYLNGSPMDFPLARVFNTFEIAYGFWGTFFHIDLTFFARCTMTLHNYLIAFFAAHALLSHWCKKSRYTQYALAAYALFIIPAGYLSQRGILRMYDAWQFNTAMWYGGSIVRVVQIPILLIFCMDLFKKLEFKKVMFIGVIFCAMLSFSSVSVTYDALFTFFILSIYGVYHTFKNKNNKKYALLWGGTTVILWMIIFIATYLYGRNYYGSGSEINYTYVTYIEQIDYMLGFNVILIASLMLSMIYAGISKNLKFIIVLSFSVFSLMIFRIPLFDYLVLSTTVDVSFSALRMVTSIQLLLVLMAGFTVLKLTMKLFSYHTYSLLVFSFLSLLIIYNIDHLDAYASFSQRGGGLSKYGFSISKVLENRYLSPTVFHDIGTYMDSLPAGKYRVIAPYMVSYEGGSLMFYTGLNYSSHNVEVCTSDRDGCGDIKIDEKNLLVEFSKGNVNRRAVEAILQHYKIDYVVTDSQKAMERMKTENFELVLTSASLEDEEFYLMKVN